MKDACPLSPMEQHEAQLVRKLVEQVGGLRNAAYFIGKSKSQIARYQSAHHHDSITLRDIGKLEERTVGQGGHPLITRYLANQSGHVLVALPTETTGPAHLMQYIGAMTRELGEVSQHILNDLADGEINHPQAGIDECFDLLRVTAGLVEALKQLADD
jgi:hypothetical protein